MSYLAFRISLIIKELKKLHSGHVHIETTLLYSDLNNEIYMRLPAGYVKYMLEVHNFTIDPTTHVLIKKAADG
jgi:hypothetical protein